MSKIKCPKCKKSELVLSELWMNHSVRFIYDNGEIIVDGNLEPGDPYRVEAFCENCGHSWKLRNVTQVTDIIKNLYEK